jgi:hypothetical protein
MLIQNLLKCHQKIVWKKVIGKKLYEFIYFSDLALFANVFVYSFLPGQLAG